MPPSAGARGEFDDNAGGEFGAVLLSSPPLLLSSSTFGDEDEGDAASGDDKEGATALGDAKEGAAALGDDDWSSRASGAKRSDVPTVKTSIENNGAYKR